MAIEVNAGFAVGAGVPIDERLVLTKAEMLAINENTMPDVYFATCKDDGKFYVFNKSNTTSETTGKFKELKCESSGSGGGVTVAELTQAEYDAMPDDNPHDGSIFWKNNPDYFWKTDSKVKTEVEIMNELKDYCDSTISDSTPKIGEDGTWWINETSTGVRAEGSKIEVETSTDSVFKLKLTDTDGNSTITPNLKGIQIMSLSQEAYNALTDTEKQNPNVIYKTPSKAVTLPDAPTVDGTYTLKVTVSSGEVKYKWV